MLDAGPETQCHDAHPTDSPPVLAKPAAGRSLLTARARPPTIEPGPDCERGWPPEDADKCADVRLSEGRPTVGQVVDDEVLDASPGDRARAAADALGDDELTAWCTDLIAGRVAWGDPATPDIGWGSPERLDDSTGYWARVWAARTLLYVWDDACTADVVAGLGDPAWRVKEMCAKVCARWEVGAAADTCAALVEDDVPRVRAAAVRVLGVAGEAEHVDPVRAALVDPEESVRTAGERALRMLERRLDRPL